MILGFGANNTSETDVAPWCLSGWMNWIGRVKYTAPYSANNKKATLYIFKNDKMNLQRGLKQQFSSKSIL